MLASIIGGVVTSVANNAIGKVADAFTAYQNKQISIEELQTRVKQAMLDAFAEIEKAAYDALAKTFDSFTKALVKSRIMQVMWAATVGSQLCVLLWHQVGIPALCYYVGSKSCYPSSGATVEWAYLLLAGCLGMGPVVLRSGPGAGNIAEQIRGLVAKK